MSYTLAELNAIMGGDPKNMNHDVVTAVMTANGTILYGVGVRPNPYAEQQAEWSRRHRTAALRKQITEKIESLFEIRFITPPETSEFIEAIITMTDSRRILEVGTHTGFTTLHMLRAVIGKDGAKVVAVEARPSHDKEFWAQFDILQFVEGWTPAVLSQLSGQIFDLVFVDSDHSVEHTAKELDALWPITRTGTIFLFHDVPAWQTPDNPKPVPVRDWLYSQVVSRRFHGLCLPSCEQLDCLDAWGKGYPRECNPGLGIFVRL